MRILGKCGDPGREALNLAVICVRDNGPRKLLHGDRVVVVNFVAEKLKLQDFLLQARQEIVKGLEV